LKIIIDYLYHKDDPEKYPTWVIPEQFNALIELFETAEYLGLDDLKVEALKVLLQK
jgi:hypothetical protein